MVLNIDGSRNRRLGMDYEEDFSIITTTVNVADGVDVGITTFRWDNAGGDPEKSFLVVQFGKEIKIFDLDDEPISGNLRFTHVFTQVQDTQNFSYSVVDGILVIVTGRPEISKITYTPTSETFSVSDTRLLIRDLFGVEDIISGFEMVIGDNVQNRPGATTSAHNYNLRNQGWGVPRINGDDSGTIPPANDPISTFVSASSGSYPANSDTVIEALYPNPEISDNRTVDRFYAGDLFRNPLGTSRAAMGYYIIDALDRGNSRLAQDLANRTRYPTLTHAVNTLPQDSTPTGATCITEFAGRIWYAGFSGEVIDGDAFSPKMSSYVLFSKVVESPSDINLCFQEGDPTSKNQPDIIDTDGGFIRLNEAYGIQKLLNIGQSLMIVAMNGVWRIVGGTDNGFTATSYIVEKITDRGCSSPESIVQLENSFMFWGDDAIYHITTDQFGSWISNNLSYGRIQILFDSINVESKRNVKGAYDSYERKVRWIYNNYTSTTAAVRELIFDTQLGAYYTNTIQKYGVNDYPKPVSIYLGRPYQVSTSDVEVVVDAEDVVVDGELVVVSFDQRVGVNSRELGYLIVTEVSPTVAYTFGRYTNTSFREWFSEDNIGVDAPAYLVTSYLSGGDFQRNKQVMYITAHLRRTEIGYDDNMNPINPSSCLVQARWGWSNSENSGKWGREFQAYRYRRMHLPQNSSDDYNTGFSTINSRSKLRGTGKVLSLKFRTEPNKDLHLYGWSLIFSSEVNV